MLTVERIKIVGAQFAVNPNHEEGTEMTPEEQQRTIDFLTELDRRRPRVTMRQDLENKHDKDAVVVRWLSKRCGFVRNTATYKAKAHAAMESGDGSRCYAKVVEVVVNATGWFFIEVETDGRTIVPLVVNNLWKDSKLNARPMPKSEQTLMVEDAVDCLDYILQISTGTSIQGEKLEELQECVQVICEEGRHELCSEVKRMLDTCVQRLEAIEGEAIRQMASTLEHHLAGMCNDRRITERRTKWLPQLLHSAEAQRAWHDWLHDHDADTREPSRLELSQWLTQVDHDLANIPAIAPCQSNDDCRLLSRAFYTDIPSDSLQRLLTLILVRHRLRERLGLPSSTLAPVEQVVRQEELRVVATIINYCDSLVKLEQVETMRNFIYAHTAYLPPDVKRQVDHLTDRFLPKDHFGVMQQTAEAMKELAAKPTSIGQLNMGNGEQTLSPSTNISLISE